MKSLKYAFFRMGVLFSYLHAMPITSITHNACHYTENLGVSAQDLTRITLYNSYSAYMRICLLQIGFVYIKNYPPELMRPSSSAPATIVSDENQNGATIVMAIFLFCYYNIILESNNASEAWGRYLDESLNSRMYPRRIVRIISVVQSKNLLLRFLCRCHENGCSCNHRAGFPSDAGRCEQQPSDEM